MSGRSWPPSLLTAQFARKRGGHGGPPLHSLPCLPLHNRKCVLNYFQQRAQARGNIGAQMNANCPAVTARKRLKIAERLGLFQHAERKWLVRQRHIDSIVGCHLYEHAGRRPSLVKLPRRMQEARSVASRRRNVQRISQMRSNTLNKLLMLGSLLNVIKHRYVVACTCATQMGLNELLDR